MTTEIAQIGEPEANPDRSITEGQYNSSAVLAEIQNQESGQKHWVKNVLILVISLVIFFQTGLFKTELSSLMVLILVLLVHESGHAFGMRLFGYKNVQMFFIPFFGAAVSGRSENVPAYKKALVCLLGPMPGILGAIVTAVVYLFTRTPFYLELTQMLLVINTFNLLPFFPLDGGRFFQEVLFSRNRWIELVFRVLAALALIGLGGLMGAWLLALFGLMGLLTAPIPLKIARMADELKPLLPPAQRYPMGAGNPYRLESATPDNSQTQTHSAEQTATIPPEVATQIIAKIAKKFGSKLSVKSVGAYTRDVWERMRRRAPGLLATVGLVSTYFVCLLLACAGLILTASISTKVETRIVEYDTPDGSTGQKEQWYYAGRLAIEREIACGKPLYHGREVSFDYNGRVWQEGQWDSGRRHGEWKIYDDGGNLITVTVYDEGQFVVRRDLEDGRWVEKTLHDLPEVLRKYYLADVNSPPSGPMSTRSESETGIAPDREQPPVSP